MSNTRRFYFSQSNHEERQALGAADALAKLKHQDETIVYTDSAPLTWKIGQGQQDDAVYLGIGVELNYPACKEIAEQAE